MPTYCSKCGAKNLDSRRFCGDCGESISHPSPASVPFTQTMLTSAHDLSLGTFFAERYQIIEQLGTGGMGNVYRALDQKVHEEVALKVIKPEIALDKETIERFARELTTARKIVHRNVGRMFDLGETGGVHYLTMEYVPGEDLRSFFHRSKQLAIGTAISIGRQICEGLAEAHRQGIVHRDLKPSNIMIDKEGNARIMDFGIARSLQAKGITGAGVIIGTPEYMSPEQAEAKEVDRRSDIYSLGVILYEMVAGRVPFEGETPLSIVLKHRTEKPKSPRVFNAQIPEELDRIILRCLEKDKTKRFQTSEELLADLRAVAGPKETPLIPKRRTTAQREITFKFKPIKLLLPGLLLLLAAAAALIFVRPLFRKDAEYPPKKEKSIAVISFENLTGDIAHNNLIKAVPNLLITKFDGMGFSYVASWERLGDILKQMGKDPEKAIPSSDGFEVCRRDGIAAIAVGRITKAGTIFAIDLKVQDVETKTHLASVTTRGEGVNSIFSQVDSLAEQIGQKLNWEMLSTRSLPPISEATTFDLTAYNYYLEGLKELNKLYFDEARQYFFKAIEIDPAFSLAYLRMAQTYFQQGDSQAAKDTMQKAMSSADRVNPKNKLYIQAWQARLIEENREKFASIFKKIIEEYPKEKEAYYWLGVYYRGQRHYDEAIREQQAVIHLDSDDVKALNEIGLCYSFKNDMQNALEYTQRAVAAAPGDANPLDTLGDVYRKMNKFDQAIETYKKALAVKPDFYFSLGKIVTTYVLKENYGEAIKWADEKITRSMVPYYKADGYLLKAFCEYWTGAYQNAIDDASMALNTGVDKDDPAVPFWSSLLQGSIRLAQGNLSLARESFTRTWDIVLKRDTVGNPIYESDREYFLGLIEIAEGKTDAVRKRLTAMDKLFSESSNAEQRDRIDYRRNILRGELLLAEGNFAEALPIFERVPFFSIGGPRPNVTMIAIGALSLSLSQPEIALSRAYEMSGETDKAIGVLEMVPRYDSKRASVVYVPPKVYYSLGRLYEKKGLKEKAREKFLKFLDCWKSADPGLPEVEDTKKRLAALKQP